MDAQLHFQIHQLLQTIIAGLVVLMVGLVCLTIKLKARYVYELEKLLHERNTTDH